MARIRTIKPEFCSSTDTGAISRDARLFFLQLLTEADDHGRMLFIPKRLCGVLYPFDDDVEGSNIVGWANECVRRGMLVRYRVAGIEYVQVKNWSKHQKISHPTESRLPAYDSEGSQILSGEVQNNSGNIPETFRSDLGTGNREVEQGKEGERDSSLRSDSSVSATADPKPEPPPAKPALELTSAPASLDAKKAERLRQVTAEAIESHNSILAAPAGVMPKVKPKVGSNVRSKQVRRCLTVARDICKDQYGATTITRQFWDAYFGECAKDDFLAGRQNGGRGHENWKSNFEYLTREEVMLKVFDRATAEAAA